MSLRQDIISNNMQISSELISALTQILVVLGICACVFGIRWLFFRKNLKDRSFLKFIGFQSAGAQLDGRFLLIWIAILIYSIANAFLQWHFSDELKQMMMKESSPYSAILNSSAGFNALVLALIYCFVKASGSEEILFRGLIAKRLYSKFGFFKGNIFQSLIFWLMHWGIFRLVTGSWISSIQLMVFITSFGLGMVLGYANYRKNGESIMPSWILHGSGNFATFISLMYLWPN